MSGQTLPSDFYDLGLIFLISGAPPTITKGYYNVNISSVNPQVEIRKEVKSASVSSPNNLNVLVKLLLAPLINHYIFYPKNNSGDISKVLSLFPATKFQKFGYSSRNDL